MAGIARYSAGLLALSCVFAQAPAPPDVVLRFDVNLVQVDAVVTDSHGNDVASMPASLMQRSTDYLHSQDVLGNRSLGTP